ATAQHADQLGLCRRRNLEVQPAQCAHAPGARLVVLNEPTGNPKLAQALLVEGFAEPAAVVDVALGNDEAREARRNSCSVAHGTMLRCEIFNRTSTVRLRHCQS